MVPFLIQNSWPLWKHTSMYSKTKRKRKERGQEIYILIMHYHLIMEILMFYFCTRNFVSFEGLY